MKNKTSAPQDTKAILNDADEYAAEMATENRLTPYDVAQLIVMAIYEEAGDIEKATKTLERITITLRGCELGAQAEEMFSGAIETLHDYKGDHITRGFT